MKAKASLNSFLVLYGASLLLASASLGLLVSGTASAQTLPDPLTGTVTLDVSGGPVTFTGDGTVSGTATIGYTFDGSGTRQAILPGTISGAGTLHFNDPGTLTLAGTNTYNGVTIIPRSIALLP